MAVPPRPARRSIARASTAALLCLATIACDGGRGGAEPPRPADMQALDPLLRTSIERAIAAAADAPSELAPGAADPWRGLAELYHANGFLAEAEAAYAVAVERAPEDAQAWYGRAVNAMKFMRPEDAFRFGESAARLAPSYAPAQWRLGEWAFDAGDLDQAMRWYEGARAADPAHTGGWLGTARVHLQREQFAQAAQIIEATVLGGADDKYGRLLLARAYRGLDRDDEARVLAAQSRGAEPNVSDPWLQELLSHMAGTMAEIERAAAALAAGRGAEALAILDPLVAPESEGGASGSNRLHALDNHAYALLSVGRAPEALERAREASALDPRGHQSLLTEALALVQIGGPKARPDAIAVLRRAIRNQPAEPSLHNQLGLLLYQESGPVAALEAYRTGLGYAPRHLNLLRNAGAMELELARFEDAVATHTLLAELLPGQPGPEIDLATAYNGLGAFGDAAAILTPLVPMLDRARGSGDPVTVRARTQLVAALRGSGANDAADREAAKLP